MTYNKAAGAERSIVTQVNDAIRENPLAAGLIGAGMAWLILGSRGLGALPGFANAASTTAHAVQDLARQAAVTVKQAASNTVSGAASIIPDLPQPEVDETKTSVGDGLQALKQGVRKAAASGSDYGATIQSSLGATLERQPLVLGAIGLAIGAGLASTFAATSLEREWMGEASAETRETMQSLASVAAARGRDVANDMRSEATRQGLTPSAAKEAVAEVADKIKHVANAVTAFETSSPADESDRTGHRPAPV